MSPALSDCCPGLPAGPSGETEAQREQQSSTSGWGKAIPFPLWVSISLPTTAQGSPPLRPHPGALGSRDNVKCRLWTKGNKNLFLGRKPKRFPYKSLYNNSLSYVFSTHFSRLIPNYCSKISSVNGPVSMVSKLLVCSYLPNPSITLAKIFSYLAEVNVVGFPPMKCNDNPLIPQKPVDIRLFPID